MSISKFSLNEQLVESYKNKKPNFGFNGLGEIVFKRSYSRLKDDDTTESWYETCLRVTNGTFDIQKHYILSNKKSWNDAKAQQTACDMFKAMFDMEFLPPGRGLFSMGTKAVEIKGGAVLNNCGFVSTCDIGETKTEPFEVLMDMAMLGVGTGFDTMGGGKIQIYDPYTTNKKTFFVVPDSREGWVESVGLLLSSYFEKDMNEVTFDYSQVRKEGARLQINGGVSSGPQPLINAHLSLKKVLDDNIGKMISVTTIVDIMNILGKCVVSGGIRRTAEIALGELSSEFTNLKNYKKNAYRIEWGWTSNNTVLSGLGADYEQLVPLISTNGEPGICWLGNMQKYSRMNGVEDNRDYRVAGANPCCEQSLENREVCNLVENMLNRIHTLDRFLEVLKLAFLYAKTVTLVKTHWPRTNEIMDRNRRIGCSVTGVAQFLGKHSIDELKKWLEIGYNKLEYYDTIYSEWFGIPKSIKKTSVKPSGTVSKVSGSTPGMHYPYARYLIVRVRIGSQHCMVDELRKCGYNIIDDPPNEPNTSIIEIPVDMGEGVRPAKDVSMWEQLSLAAFLQKYWADNQVSVTITFNKQTESRDIANALNFFQYQLKSVSFLPVDDDLKLQYKYLPNEEITKEQYDELSKRITTNSALSTHHDSIEEMGCDGDKCMLDY